MSAVNTWVSDFRIVFGGIAYNPRTMIYVHTEKSENKYKFVGMCCVFEFLFHLFLSVSVGLMVENFWQNRKHHIRIHVFVSAIKFFFLSRFDVK